MTGTTGWETGLVSQLTALGRTTTENKTEGDCKLLHGAATQLPAEKLTFSFSPSFGSRVDAEQLPLDNPMECFFRRTDKISYFHWKLCG